MACSNIKKKRGGGGVGGNVNKDDISLFIYILAAYTQLCPANVNMKHYRSHSRFGLVGPSISFWQPKQLPVGLADTTFSY